MTGRVWMPASVSEYAGRCAPVAEDHIAQHERRPRATEHLDAALVAHPDLGCR